MSYFDENEEEVFEDKPEEIDGQMVGGQWVPNTAPPVQVSLQNPTPRPQPIVKQEIEEIEEEVVQEEEDVSSVLTDARLRLEMGKLYELVMKHDIFEGVDADPKAVKNVTKEIRAYAQERMEIMLGMRQEKPQDAAAFPMDMFPFNSMEVEALKALASAATKGASRDAEPLDLVKPPARTTLNPIGGVRKVPAVINGTVKKPLQTRPQTPVKRAAANEKIQRILEEEGLTMDEINQVFDPNREPLDRKKLSKMTEDEIMARNRQVSLRNKRVENPAAVPMPSPEQLAQAYEQRSQTVEAQNPKWRQLIEAAKAMPPTLATNVKE
jgi:hypothetical protein